MNEFALIVEFEIKAEEVDKFLPLIEENARLPVEREPGCKQFDVLEAQDSPDRVMLYEIYDAAAAFQAHIKMPHVATFFEKAKPLIVQQSNQRLTRRAESLKR
jgi:(4S)-4-hydroxy-5-phosphonooxypentane-2,3-dione isomerase